MDQGNLRGYVSSNTSAGKVSRQPLAKVKDYVPSPKNYDRRTHMNDQLDDLKGLGLLVLFFLRQKDKQGLTEFNEGLTTV